MFNVCNIYGLNLQQGNMEERKKSYHEARSLLVSVKTKEGE